MTTKTFTFAPTDAITADIRAVELDGAWWFVAADACRALGLNMAKGATHHLANLTPDQKTSRPAAEVDPRSFREAKGRGGLRGG